MKIPFPIIAALALLASVVTAGSTGRAWADPPIRVQSVSPQSAGEIQIPVGKSRVINLNAPASDVLIGNPETADVVPLSDRSVYIIGKKAGSTSLALYGANHGTVAILDVTITPDLPTLRRRINEVMPREPVEIRAANDAIVVSGTVSSGDRMKKALALAEDFAPGKVTNMLTLTGGQQVILAVRFAEVQRDVAKQLGIRAAAVIGKSHNQLALLSGVVPSPAAFASVAGLLKTGNVTLEGVLDALEQKGVVKTLAEPNLIATSGETAKFLAGGEFPIPVEQSTTAGINQITVQFKEFGVKLGFTPTVIGDDVINLVVEPEVSDIDRVNGVTVSGLIIPGLTTRRAQTTVNLRHGESFAIAGLIRSNFTDSVEQFPGLGDLPILGALFRSSSFRRQETELVIIVTPYLARPVQPGQLSLPTDRFVPPSEMDLILRGQMLPRPPLAGGTPVSQAPMPLGAGLAGHVGYAQ